ncbi:MAG: hypothetical protein LAO20_00250 [Acidobacteriia bacterium]|nr:hypothetical protein [Terriglobia bacterium]
MSFIAYSRLCCVIAASFVCLSSAAPVGSDVVQFFRTTEKIESLSPNSKAKIVLLPPVSENADPTLEAQVRNEKLLLGSLQRSAYLSWRPDSRVAVLWDLTYSNHYFVRLLQVDPKLSEIKGFDELIRQRALKEFRVKEVIHYWPHVQGWIGQRDLLVIVCADGAPTNTPVNTKLVGFERGYLIDTDKRSIKSELNPSDLRKLTGPFECGE